MTPGSLPSGAQRWRTLLLLVASAFLLAGLILADPPTRAVVVGSGTAVPQAVDVSLGSAPQLAASRTIHAYDELERSTLIIHDDFVQGARELAFLGRGAERRGAGYTYDSRSNLARTNVRLGDRALAPRAIGPADVAVIGKVDDLGAATLRPGERTLLNQLPNQGSPRLNYLQNDRVLPTEMGRGVPIRDVSVDPVTGALRNNTGFLQAERNILTNHDWVFDPKSSYWYPPGW